MRVIMFKEQFAEAVRLGRKKQTVLHKLKGGPMRAGEPVSLCKWSGSPRRSSQEVIGSTTLTGVCEITIDEGELRLAGVTGKPRSMEAFAKDNGFKNWADLVAWFNGTHGLPFNGVLLMWDRIQ